LRILVSESATTVPPSQLLLDDRFYVLRKSRVAQSCQDTGRFRDEFLCVVLPVDPNWVDLEQDLEHLVVQGAVLSLETLARCAAFFGFVHCWPWHRTPVFW
jgi:hypothetical protein